MLARVVRPQGRIGEVLCELFTDFPDQFTTAESLFLTDAGGARTQVNVERYWLPKGRSAGRVVLKFAGVESITKADTLRGAAIEMPQARRLVLDADTYYVSDLVGCGVYNEETLLGTLTDVQFPVGSGGKRLVDSAPLFVISGGGMGEILVPFANAYAPRIDTERRAITLALPAGLSALNG